MVKLVDALDSKSSGSDTVSVQVRPWAPKLRKSLQYGEFFVYNSGMASNKDYLVYVLELLREVSGVSYKYMMSEFILYKNGIIFGGIYDNRFLIKKTKSLEGSELKEQIPYPTAKPMLLVDSEDPDEIKELVLQVVNDLKGHK